MSFPIDEYETIALLYGYTDAFYNFQPRVYFNEFNLSLPIGRMKAMVYLRKKLSSEVFVHLFGYLLGYLNVMVHPMSGKLVYESSFFAFSLTTSMYSYVNNALISAADQNVLIDKLIHNRACLADGCCRKCGTVKLNILMGKRICHHVPLRLCTERGEPGHFHFGRAKISLRHMVFMRYLCFGCMKMGYHLDQDTNFLCDKDNRVLSTILISDTL